MYLKSNKYLRITLISISVIVILTSCAHRHKPITFYDSFERSPTKKWGYPLRRTVFEINSQFGDIRREGSRVYHHQGVDIKAERDEPVYAVLDGIVLFAGKQGNYGKLIILSHSDGWETRYAHLNSISVKINQKVRKGEMIGRVGKTGNATGYHLHFEIRRNNIPQNPLLIIPLPH